MANRNDRGLTGGVLAVALAATTVLGASQVWAESLASENDPSALHILPWSPAPVQKPLLDLLKEHDRKASEADWPSAVESAPGTGLMDVSGPAVVEPPSTTQKPVFGTLGTPIGKLSVVSEKLDANGHIKGLDFMRLDVPGWDIGVHGSALKFSHRWGAKSSDHPFANREKRRVAIPN